MNQVCHLIIMDQKRKLAALLGTYIDEEAELFVDMHQAYEKGVLFSCDKFSYDIWQGMGISFINFLENNFLIINESTRIRNNLTKPFLMADEIYNFDFFINKNKFSFQIDFLKLQKQPIDLKVPLNEKNINFLKNINKNKNFYLKVSRLNKGKLYDLILNRDKFLDVMDYANSLKFKIIQSLKTMKNPELLEERLKLWGLTTLEKEKIYPSDFGVKNLVHLNKIFTHFKFDLNNEQLFLYESEQLKYEKKLQEILTAFNRNKLKITIT